MKRFIHAVFILAAILLTSCQNNEPFTGYIIGKSYTPGHWGNQEPTTYIEQGTVSTAAAVAAAIAASSASRNHANQMREAKTWYKSQFKLFVANVDDTKQFNVDSSTWANAKLGSKITF